MKERIMEYAEQARLHATIVHPDTHDIKVWGEVYHAKFAELIVRECINKIENEAEQYAAPVWAVELVNDIKDSFGIAE
jgi:hypothetical protein